ncbi:MAG: ABC transporter ATP-binding protein [Acidimicrobiales bacterium]|jgi:branched-chain amino acid transport system ATP-binding protein|nr:ABC transporter ATP-binding protein [Acidimicrobiales bacterium]
MTPLLELRDVHAAYDAIEVLHGIDLAVDRGEVLAVLGPNGAGKTTLLRVVSGELVPTRGDLLVGGRRLNGAAMSDLARAGLCTIPEGRGVFPNLTVQENLWMMTHRGLSRRDVEEAAFGYFPRLQERQSQLAGTLSGGEQQMLAVARAVSTRPALLLLDELSMGLAPIIVGELFAAVGRLAAEGVAILVVEQFADAALALADHAVVIAQGRIAASGTPTEIKEALRSTYLGADTPA